MIKLLFATQNRGKQREIKEILSSIEDVSVVFPQDVSLEDFEVEETGSTFRENAYLKAKAFAQKSGLISIADDSGLVVEALDGKPGVYSDRLFPGSPREKNLQLLEMMKDIEDRRAEFVTTLCLVDAECRMSPRGRPLPEWQDAEYFEGRISGKIAHEILGDEGFGYDPVFIPDGYDETWGQMGTEEKSKMSHRKIGLERLKKHLSRIVK